MPEQLARAEQVEDPPVVNDLDRAAVDHAQTYSTGPAPCEKIVVPRGLTSVSVTAATRASSSAPTAFEGRPGPEEAGDVRHLGRGRARLAPTAASATVSTAGQVIGAVGGDGLAASARTMRLSPLSGYCLVGGQQKRHQEPAGEHRGPGPDGNAGPPERKPKHSPSTPVMIEM